MNFNQFAQELAVYPPEQVLFVALGNEFRGDDAAGLVFLDKLQEMDYFTESQFLKVYTNPENYLQHILESNAQVVVFIDAARFGGEAGEIKWLDSQEIESVGISTHAFSIQLVEQFLLNQRPLVFKYLGIEPLRTDVGDNLSPMVLTNIAVFFAHMQDTV